MSKRKAISKRCRFEVFKRDSFTCQYCGHQAPDVVLEVDHIIPVSKGGTNDVFNLLTSCEDCNSGKSDIPLERKEEIRKQKAELDRLQERRNQLGMMAKWRIELLNANDDAVNKLCELWSRLFDGKSQLSDFGRKEIRKLLRKFSFQQMAEAMQTAVESYDEPSTAFEKIGGCARMAQLKETNPEIPEFYFIRGICRKRFPSVPWNAIPAIRKAFEAGVPLAEIKRAALECEWWRRFEDRLEAMALEVSKP